MLAPLCNAGGWSSSAAEKAICHRDFAADYDLYGPLLGSGMSGCVRGALCKRSGRVVAVKICEKDCLSEKALHDMRVGLDLHRQVDHPHIVKIEEIYESDTHIHVVMECLHGRDMFDRVASGGGCSEATAAGLAVQVLHALAHLHARGIMHRDIKLENIVYQEFGGESIKLIDLDFCARVENPEDLGNCGTLQYCAPEVVSGQQYDQSADMWSTGSLLYTALTGRALFCGDDCTVATKTRECALDLCPAFFELSGDAQEFLRDLLSLNPSERPSAREALRDRWLRKNAPEQAAAALAALEQEDTAVVKCRRLCEVPQRSIVEHCTAVVSNVATLAVRGSLHIALGTLNVLPMLSLSKILWALNAAEAHRVILPQGLGRRTVLRWQRRSWWPRAPVPGARATCTAEVN